MAKRSVDEILNDSLPEQSKNLYKKKWDFGFFRNSPPPPTVFKMWEKKNKITY